MEKDANNPIKEEPHNSFSAEYLPVHSKKCFFA
jgi:hypothetical protein